MKPYKILLIVGLFTLAFPINAKAFNPIADCQIKLDGAKIKELKTSLKTILSDYTNSKYSTYVETKDTYLLCFSEASPGFIPTSTLIIDTSTIKKSLVVYNLIVSGENLTGNNLLTLSGTNITLDHAILTGPNMMLQINGSNITVQDSTLTSSGTVFGVADGLSGVILKNVQLTGKDTLLDLAKVSKLEGTNSFTTTGTGPVIKLPANYGEFAIKDATITGAGLGAALEIPSGVKATIGPSNSFTNFATGIEVKQNATANITQNKFISVEAPIYWETPFWATDPISVDWFGKHMADETKVDRLAGKIDLTECKGSVEMYLKENVDETINKTYYPLEYHATCPVAELKDKPLKLTLADKSEKEITVGSCYFDCDKLTDVLKDNYVSFLYSSAANQTAEFIPLPAIKIGDLGDVINIQIGGIVMGPTTSGVTTETTEPTDPIAPPTVPANFDPSNPKGQTNDTNNSDGDGGQVGEGTGGCSLIR